MTNTTKQFPTADESLAAARLQNAARYARVERVVAQTTDGRPARVVVVCSVEGCSTERECAVQDLFQVHRCVAHQDAAVRSARAGRAKKRTTSLKGRIAQLEAELARVTADDEAETEE
jgi:hypothetical protein